MAICSMLSCEEPRCDIYAQWTHGLTKAECRVVHLLPPTLPHGFRGNCFSYCLEQDLYKGPKWAQNFSSRPDLLAIATLA